MAGLDRALPAGNGLKYWLPLAVIGLVAVIAGVVLPQMLPEPATVSSGPPATPVAGNLSYSPPAWPEAPNHQSMFLRLGLGTGAVLLLCVGTLWCCKRWLHAVPTSDSPNAQLRLIETLPLGQRCCVHLIHVGNRPALVAADGGGIKSVVPLPDSFSTLLEPHDEAPSISQRERRGTPSREFPDPNQVQL